MSEVKRYGYLGIVEEEDGEVVKWEDYAALKAQRDALAAENAYLLPKAASELSNAWVLHKYWVGIHAALMHMKVGRIYDAEQWLQNTIAGPGIEAPNFKLTEEIEAWATEQSKDSISHSRALEILTTQTPTTGAYLNSVRAEGVEMFGELHDATAEKYRSELPGCYGELLHQHASSQAVKFAAQLRAGKESV